MEKLDDYQKRTSSVKVHITGSQRMVNELICFYLSMQAGFHASEGPVDESIKIFSSSDEDRPNVMMLDNYSGEVVDRLTNECENFLGALNGTPAIIFNFNSEKRLKKWISYGVRGLLYDQEPSQNMIKAIKTVADGHMWFPRQAMSKFLTERWSRKKTFQDAKNNLTPRELEILALIARGTNNNDIAEKLFISPYTVKVHVQNIYRKIGVPNRVKAVIWANENIVLNK